MSVAVCPAQTEELEAETTGVGEILTLAVAEAVQPFAFATTTV